MLAFDSRTAGVARAVQTAGSKDIRSFMVAIESSLLGAGAGCIGYTRGTKAIAGLACLYVCVCTYIYIYTHTHTCHIHTMRGPR